MKNKCLLCFGLLTGALSLQAQTTVLLTEDFEGYEADRITPKNIFGITSTATTTSDNSFKSIFPSGKASIDEVNYGNVLAVSRSATAEATFDFDDVQEGNQAYAVKTGTISVDMDCFFSSPNNGKYATLILKNSQGGELIKITHTTGSQISSVLIGGSEQVSTAFSFSTAGISKSQLGNYKNATFVPHLTILITSSGNVTATFKGAKDAVPVSVVGSLGDMTNDLASMSFYSQSGGDDRARAIDNIVISHANVQMANYSIEYRLADNTWIKNVSGSGISGSTIPALTDGQKEKFFEDGIKYVYVSDNIGSQTIAADGSSVVVVTVEEGIKYNYTVRCVAPDGTTVLQTLVDSLYYADETVSYLCPRFLKIADNSLVECPPSSNNFQKSFTLDENNKVVDYVYTATTMGNIVFCKEAEEIEGMEPVCLAYVPERQSAGKSAYVKEDVTIATLPIGKYSIHMGTRANANYSVYVNDTTGTPILTAVVNSNSQQNFNEEFTLTQTSDIIVQASTCTGTVDWIYIQKTGDVTPYNLTIGTSGMATLYLSYAATIPFGVKAYYASAYADGELTMTRINATIPAHTGVLVTGNAGTCSFAEATAVDAIEGNLMSGSMIDGSVITSADDYLFHLTTGEHGVNFYYYAAGGNTLTATANKAYLAIPASSFDSAAPSFTIRYDEGGATSVLREKLELQAEEDVYYDLTGRKVRNPQAGIYIVNGHKVIIR